MIGFRLLRTYGRHLIHSPLPFQLSALPLVRPLAYSFGTNNNQEPCHTPDSQIIDPEEPDPKDTESNQKKNMGFRERVNRATRRKQKQQQQGPNNNNNENKNKQQQPQKQEPANQYVLALQEALKNLQKILEKASKNKAPILRIAVACLVSYYILKQLKKDELYESEEIEFGTLCNKIKEGKVTKIEIYNYAYSNYIISEGYIYDTEGKVSKIVVGNVATFKQKIEELQASRVNKVPITETRKNPLNYVLHSTRQILGILFYVALAGVIFWSYKRSMGQPNASINFFQAGPKASHEIKAQTEIKTRFNDVAGLADAKVEIMEFVDFLKKPEKYKKLGARIPKGALLSGPPGTGKTMLAKACAGEAGVPFFSMSGSEFVEMFVGVGAARVRELFKAAKQKTPSIIFIDEIDAIGRKREDSPRGGSDERANTLNQLLVEMDGFDTSVDVIVLAATNRKELLDSALTRPGRFDRSIEINLPQLEGRKEIFMVHLKPLKLSPQKTMEQYANRLSTLTPGFSGADIYSVCNEAAINSVRKNKDYVDSKDFEAAIDRVLGGLEKKAIVTQKEKNMMAYYEAGKAVVSWFLEGAAPLLKLTIVPRSKAATGFSQSLPNENSLQTKQELLDLVCVAVAGRSTEKRFFDLETTTPYRDLQRAAQIARKMVLSFGMSEKIGYVSYQQNEYQKGYSDQINEEIDKEVMRIVKESSDKAAELIQKHKDKVQALAKKLVEQETLDSKAIISVLGERPFPPKKNYKKYLEETSASE